jgi:methionyl aminopeptidase
MAVVVHSPEEIEKLRRAGRVAAETLRATTSQLRAGMSTKDIDRLVQKDTQERGASCSQLGYKGFPAGVCTSRNEIVCHGVPSEKDLLLEGDIINVDVTSELDGFHGDCSITVAIGKPSPDALRVLDVAKRALEAAIAVVKDGARLGDIGAVIQELAKKAGCGVVKEFGGHGIGTKMHMDPHVSHFGERGKGLRLRAGMAFTIEPMITVKDETYLVLERDNWTVRTADRTPSAQFEHTVLVTRTGCEVLTAL